MTLDPRALAALALLAAACGGAASNPDTTPPRTAAEDEPADDAEAVVGARAEMGLYGLVTSTGPTPEGSLEMVALDEAARAHFEARRFEEAARTFLRAAAAIRAAADAEPDGPAGQNRRWTCKNAAVAFYDGALEAEALQVADELDDPACAAAIRSVIPAP